MPDYDYPWSICKYCRFTDFGYAPINTGPHNLCEGMGCDEAKERYEEKTGKVYEDEEY